MSSKRYTPEFRAVVIRQERVKSYLRVRTPKVESYKFSWLEFSIHGWCL